MTFTTNLKKHMQFVIKKQKRNFVKQYISLSSTPRLRSDLGWPLKNKTNENFEQSQKNS